MTWVLIIYILTAGQRPAVTTVSGYESKEKCDEAAKLTNVVIIGKAWCIPGPGAPVKEEEPR